MSIETPAKAAKKLSLKAVEGRRFTYAFDGCEDLTFDADAFDPKAKEAQFLLGVKTGSRNSTIGTDTDGSVGTPAEMRARMAAWVERMNAGILRLVTAGEEKGGVPLLILEAAAIYKAMTACVKATGDIEGWTRYDRPALESLRAEVEALDDVVINQPDVDKAKAAAAAKGEDVEAAEKKAIRTRLDLLRANDIFKAALAEAEDARRAAKKAALRASIKAKAAADAAPAAPM